MAHKPPKTSSKHPYAAIEHRVIDSPAYADLSFSAQALLVQLARQLTKKNNGHLQASFAWCSKRGFGSEHTLRAAIADLIGHGFIYRTRSHGANKAWARYAVTWLSITEKEGLFLSGFKPFAWRDWQPEIAMSNGKSSRKKVLDQSGRKCSFTSDNPAESAGTRGAKSADYEFSTNRKNLSAVESALTGDNGDDETTVAPANDTDYGQWVYGYLDRLKKLVLQDFCSVANTESRPC